MTIYLIGIGGNAAAYLVDLAHAHAWTVRGSDAVKSENTEMARKKGSHIEIGHSAQFITKDIDEVWYSAAITDQSDGYCELQKSRELGIPTKTFATALADFFNTAKIRVAVAGTHGKSSTTAMIGWILEKAGMNPTVAVGAKLEAWHGNGRIGDADIMIIEADEYAKRFLQFKPTHSIVTSIEADHFDTYPTLPDLVTAFRQFVSQTTEHVIAYGLDQLIDQTVENQTASVVRYGLYQPIRQFDVWAEVGVMESNTASRNQFTIGPANVVVSLKLPGLHNVLNATAAFAMADALGIDHALIALALSSFPGVARRFELLGEVDGVPVIDDYGHHPTEIEATLAGARQFYPDREIILVYEPHQAGRLAHLMSETADSLTLAETVVLLPVYTVAGREEQLDIKNATSAKLAEMVRQKGGKIVLAESYNQATDRVHELLHKNALVITMGATDVWQVGKLLLAR